MGHQMENGETEEVGVESRGRSIILRSKETFFCPCFQGAARKLPERNLTEPSSRGPVAGVGFLGLSFGDYQQGLFHLQHL